MIPATTNFNQRLEDVIGKIEFTEEGIKQVHSLIEAGVIPTFAVGFTGTPNEDGVYTDVTLMEVSMLTEPQGEE